jgi:hypothetical protein
MDNVNNFFIRIKTLRDKFIEVLRQLSSSQWNLQPVIDLINRNYDELIHLRQMDEKQCLNALYQKCTRPLLEGKYLETRSIAGIIDLLSGTNPPEPTLEDRYWGENDAPIPNPFFHDILIGIDANGVIPNDRLQARVINHDRDETDPPCNCPIVVNVQDQKYTSEELLLIGVVLTQLATAEILAPIWDQLNLITNCSKLIYRKMECEIRNPHYNFNLE